jgi:hypothetical protein
MNPHDIVLAWSMLPGCFRSGGAIEYVKSGKEIPELLLPGRALMKMKESQPEAQYYKFISTDWQNVAPWFIKIMCGK